MDAVGIFFFAIAMANVAAVWCMGASIGAAPSVFKRSPTFKAECGDSSSTRKEVR
jgi:hypothetical protein